MCFRHKRELALALAWNQCIIKGRPSWCMRKRGATTGRPMGRSWFLGHPGAKFSCGKRQERKRRPVEADAPPGPTPAAIHLKKGDFLSKEWGAPPRSFQKGWDSRWLMLLPVLGTWENGILPWGKDARWHE